MTESPYLLAPELRVGRRTFSRFAACFALVGAMSAGEAWGRTPQHHPTHLSKSWYVAARQHAAHTATKQHRPVNLKRPHHAIVQRKHMMARELPLIAIDPGHGGNDSGAVGSRGTLEKDVTLAAARELRRLLLATGKYRVAMTRSDDAFVSLAARVAFVRSHHASVVIAIHANASPDKGAHGASVWVRSGELEENVVTHLAANRAEMTKIANALTVQLPPASSSARLQYTMIDNLSDDVRMDAAPARQAHFYVLGLRDVPSVLLEMGFLTNRRDEVLLTQSRYRRKITESIRDALDDYFMKIEHPDAKQT